MTAQTLVDQQDKPTARGMLDLLRAHYMPSSRPAAGIFAPEIQAPGSNRRADLIWQGCTAAAGHQLVGHEIKVTRQDLLAELDDTTKSDPWQRYCDRWWLVVPAPALIDGLELPPTWGVLAPPSGRRRSTMTVVVPAPELRPAEQAPALRTLATWLHWKLNDARSTVAQRDAEVQRLVSINQGLHERLDEAGARPNLNEPREQRIVTEIVRRLGDVDFEGRIGDWTGRVTIDDVVAALSDLKSVNARARELGSTALSTVRDLRRVLQQVDRGGLDGLEKAARKLVTQKTGDR